MRVGMSDGGSKQKREQYIEYVVIYFMHFLFYYIYFIYKYIFYITTHTLGKHCRKHD